MLLDSQGGRCMKGILIQEEMRDILVLLNVIMNQHPRNQAIISPSE